MCLNYSAFYNQTSIIVRLNVKPNLFISCIIAVMIVFNQLNTWHDSIGDATLGDAILDRLLHNAHRIEVAGPSMRKNQAKNLAKEEN